MGKIKAKLIIDARPSESTLQQICAESGTSPEQQSGFMVFEIEHKDKIMYCSWAGGRMTSEQTPEFTLIGQAATEALVNLPWGSNKLIIQHMELGPTPLVDKLTALLDKLDAGAKVCFLGDLRGSLDGQIQFVFDIVGIKQIAH